jgi:hypothetical protein
MSKQIIFCVETNKKSDTDWKYIFETINWFYEKNNDIKYTPIYMGSIAKYNSPKVTKEIKEKTRMYFGETHVVYCADVDSIGSDSYQLKIHEELKDYCNKNNYSFIWFNEDIESVYLGKKVANKEKVKESVRFTKNKLISNIKKEDLRKKKDTEKGSNILLVLEKLIGKINKHV